eukprot:GEMP01030015.1.p1 GENE.GEMP01030015.1~~GEMP01030015.1.p1  ORF type:complete len:322 (+),score=62.27 GEMP01030015.1:168-1133(+)
MDRPKRARKRICPEVVTDEQKFAGHLNTSEIPPAVPDQAPTPAKAVSTAVEKPGNFVVIYDGKELAVREGGNLVCNKQKSFAWSSPCPGTPQALAVCETFGAALCARNNFHELRVVLVNGGALAWPVMCLPLPDPHAGKSLSIVEGEHGKHLLLLHDYRLRVWNLNTNEMVFDQRLTIAVTRISLCSKPFAVTCKSAEATLTYSPDFKTWVTTDALDVDPMSAFFGALSSKNVGQVENAFAALVTTLGQRREVTRMDDLLCMFLEGPSWAFDQRMALELERRWVQVFLLPTLRQEHAFLSLAETYIDRKGWGPTALEKKKI